MKKELRGNDCLNVLCRLVIYENETWILLRNIGRTGNLNMERNENDQLETEDAN